MIPDRESIVSNFKMTDSFFVKKLEEVWDGNSIATLLSVKGGEIILYNDIYYKDQKLSNKYFANK